MSNDLTAALASASTSMLTNIGDQVRSFISDMTAQSPLIAARVTEIGTSIKTFTQQALTGEIGIDDAQVSIEREIASLDNLKAQVVEVAAHDAIERAKVLLKGAAKVAISLVEGAITTFVL